jgi:hypothetical protein
MSRTHTSISNTALDLANLAREAHALETANRFAREDKIDDMIYDREEDMTAEFVTLAKLLGFSVFKADASTNIAAE